MCTCDKNVKKNKISEPIRVKTDKNKFCLLIIKSVESIKITLKYIIGQVKKRSEILCSQFYINI